jgi:DNA-binding CsgD family transcriptional regulator
VTLHVNLSSVTALDGRLRAMSASYGFVYFYVGTFPSLIRHDLLANCVSSNWPAGALSAYSKAHLFRDSGLMTHIMRSVILSEKPTSLFSSGHLAEKERRVHTLFCSSNFAETFGCAPFTAGRKRYLFAFSGPKGWQARGDLPVLMFEVQSIIETLASQNTVEPTGLTEREIECLEWSAAGKNSREIAQILEISSLTIDGYLKNALHKLGAVNRTQAVAKACQLGLL